MVAGWVGRSEEFLRRLAVLPGEVRARRAVAPPADLAELARVEAALGARLPTPLARFFAGAAAEWELRYSWRPTKPREPVVAKLVTVPVFGGGRIGPVGALPDLVRDCRDWARKTWIADEPVETRLWTRTLPFMALVNGDHLGVGRDGRVVYLNHDDRSTVIARSFDAFLAAWEQLCYLGPELWSLQPFRDPATGLLSPTCAAAELLRGWFSL